jgi:cardiolipin synthase
MISRAISLALAAGLGLAGCASAPLRVGPEAAAAILEEGGMRRVASSPIQRLSMNGLEWYDRALELIASAEDYILVDTFLLTDHPRARAVLQALEGARERGVRVFIVVDSASFYRTYPMSAEPVPALVAYARGLGLPIVEHNPLRGWRIPTLLRLFSRDHRKFWIVDGRRAVLGGQNIDFDSLRSIPESGCIDAMVEFSSKGAIAELRDSFLRSWNAYSVDPLDPADFSLRDCPTEAGVWIVDQGMAKDGRVTPMFDALFARAEREILLVQCYAFMTPALLGRIRAAAERGCEVKIVLSGGHISPRFAGGSYYGIKDMKKAGAKVYIYESPEGSLLHYKLMMADGEMAAIGSANYNFRSQILSRELSAVFDDEESLSVVKDRLGEIEPYFREVGDEEAASYRGPSYFLFYLLMQFGG